MDHAMLLMAQSMKRKLNLTKIQYRTCISIVFLAQRKFNERKIYFTKVASDAQADYNQSRRDHLLTFLKGSKEQKAILEKEQPTLFKYFKEVWMVRNSHMLKGLP
jgi:hypothetical protein